MRIVLEGGWRTFARELFPFIENMREAGEVALGVVTCGRMVAFEDVEDDVETVDGAGAL